MEDKKELLKSLPKVDECLAALAPLLSQQRVPQRLAKKAVQQSIDQVRQDILSERKANVPADLDGWTRRFTRLIAEMVRPSFRRVLNGAGVIVHTNLGRSLLASEATAQLAAAASHYTNLEFDLATGKRGSRYALVEEILCDLTGAEAALVVNNNAAAVLICLETLARGSEVVVSRGQLVEIGGSFRIPDVMAKSGAELVEVGATNRTHLYDYEGAISEKTALLLRVHTSNFRVIGFTSEVSADELVQLGERHQIPVMEDLGSGSLLDLSHYGLPSEPTVQEIVAAGIDVVTFSGDKLLGGPQAGIIVGKKKYIDRIKKNPLNRALRIDKFTLASLESTLRLYYDTEAALEMIPTLRMISEDPAQVKKRARRFLRRIDGLIEPRGAAELVPAVSRVGGGALPEYNLASWAVELQLLDGSVNLLERELRALPVPVIGRIEHDRFVIDFKTIQDHEVKELADALIDYFRPLPHDV